MDPLQCKGAISGGSPAEPPPTQSSRRTRTSTLATAAYFSPPSSPWRTLMLPAYCWVQRHRAGGWRRARGRWGRRAASRASRRRPCWPRRPGGQESGWSRARRCRWSSPVPSKRTRRCPWRSTRRNACPCRRLSKICSFVWILVDSFFFLHELWSNSPKYP